MHIHLGSMIIHGIIYSIIYRLLRNFSTPELLVMGAVVIVGVLLYNKSNSGRRRRY